MARLSLKQLLFAIALGAIFAALQSETPSQAMEKASTVSCSPQQPAGRC